MIKVKQSAVWFISLLERSLACLNTVLVVLAISLHTKIRIN